MTVRASNDGFRAPGSDEAEPAVRNANRARRYSSPSILTPVEFELDGDEDLTLGQRIEVLDGGGRHHSATVVERVTSRWRLRTQA